VTTTLSCDAEAGAVGVKSNLVIADPGDFEEVASSDDPASHWHGFTFNGLDRVKLCALLSLLKSGSPDGEFEEYLDWVSADGRRSESDERPCVSTVRPDEVAELAVTAAMEDAELDQLAMEWGATEEFAGWSEWEIGELLRRIGDLAETAMLQEKCLILRHSQ
jgi:hypothetical protein